MSWPELMADSALTVAAVDAAADELASFSPRGPRFGDYGPRARHRGARRYPRPYAATAPRAGTPR